MRRVHECTVVSGARARVNDRPAGYSGAPNGDTEVPVRTGESRNMYRRRALHASAYRLDAADRLLTEVVGCTQLCDALRVLTQSGLRGSVGRTPQGQSRQRAFGLR